METLENKGNYPKRRARSGAIVENVDRTCQQIGTKLTHPGSSNVRSRVYFIAGGDFIKIGVSVSPLDRLAGHQTSCPFDLKLLADIPGDASDELRIQANFARYHIRGEWFRSHPEILDYIENCRRRKGARRRKPNQNLNGRDWIWV